MREAQILSRRDRDLNSPQQFYRAMGVSLVAHAIAALLIVLTSLWTYRPKLIVPGYRVALVSPEQLKPHSLLEPEKPKPEKPRMKTPAEKPTAKAEPAVKKKIISEAKKIVPKKEIEKAPPPKKEKIAPPAKEKPKREDTGAAPRKTVVTEGVPFPYLWFLKVLERKVQENWITHGIDVSGRRGDPVVRFKILRDGSVTGLTLEKSSGSVALDASALEAVTNAAPFPPLPDGYPNSFLGVHFGFNYEQRER